MNSGLQCLCHIEPLVAYFLNGDFEREINNTNEFSSKGEVARAFAKLMCSIWQAEDSVCNPQDLHSKLARFAPHLFESGEQQDVQEFLSFCIDGLHEDLNRVTQRPMPITSEQELADERLGREQGEEVAAALAWFRHLEHGKSFLVDLMQGQLRSIVTCSQCQHTSRRFDPFLYLSVPVTKGMMHVTDCINKFLEEERLTGSEQWFCERCERKVDAIKKIDIWKLPPVLVLHLKRFEFDASTFTYRKTENRLSMKLTFLDLSDFCSSEQRDGAVYNVVGVSNHLGSFGSGHYTATCRVGGLGQNTWQHFNDGLVTSYGGRNVVTKETYMIFLMRDHDPKHITKNNRASRRGSRPMLLRRQTLSVPENWPHPNASVAAVLRATSKGAMGTEAAASGSSASDSAGSSYVRTSVEIPAEKRRKTLHDFFAADDIQTSCGKGER